MPARPRGVSDNIPQSVIDDMMKEDHQSPKREELLPEDVIQPKARPESPEPMMSPPPKKEEAPIINLPDEPGTDNPDSFELLFRMPLSGERIKRRFLKSDTVKLLYDFVDHLQIEEKCQFEGVSSYTSKYEILQPRPRVVYTDRSATLESLGFHPRGAILQI